VILCTILVQQDYDRLFLLLHQREVTAPEETPLLNSRELEAFRYEIRNWNNIPLGSMHCRVNCIFCKINGDRLLRRFPPLPPITREDLVEGFAYLDPDYRFARLGAGVIVAPHTDPFLHPEIYEFIDETCRTLTNKTVTTVTTGSFIETHRLDDLHRHRNFGIDLSLVTMQASRERLMTLATRNKLHTLLETAPIRKISVMFTGDLDELERDLDMLVAGHLDIRCEQILVRRIEHVHSSPRVLKKISHASIAGYEGATALLRERYPGVEYTVPYLDERFPREEYWSEAQQRLTKVRRRLGNYRDRKTLVIAPEATGNFFRSGLANLDGVSVHIARNETYGGSVTVGGLLTQQELATALETQTSHPDLLIVPREMYDLDDQDLTGSPRHVFETRHGIEVLPV
jgi:hypothetical protein